MAVSRRAPKSATSKFKTALVVLFSGSAFLACGLGVRAAMQSPLFLVQVVEVSELGDTDVPLDAKQISDLARIPIGRMNLFSLDLAGVERRVLTHPWVREVRLQKRFPQTVAIDVTVRDPRAFLQRKDGTLSYIDSDGQDFGRVDLSVRSDLPLIVGLDPKADRQKVVAALELVSAWGRGKLGQLAPAASVDYHPDRGYRVWVSYVLGPATGPIGGPGVNFSTNARKARTFVDLGLEIDREGLESRLARLESVFGYLSLHSIQVRHVLADAGKKIVVKIARGS